MDDVNMWTAAVADRSWLDTVHMTTSGGSPLMRAIRRRRWERAHPEEVVATHDSKLPPATPRTHSKDRCA